jgi:hypothetical protein
MSENDPLLPVNLNFMSVCRAAAESVGLPGGTRRNLGSRECPKRFIQNRIVQTL